MRGNLMDANDSVSILCLHSAYLRTLTEQLESQVAQFEQTLQEQNIETYGEAGLHIDSLLKCSALIVNTAENFHQRLVAFRERSKEEKDPLP